MSDTTTRRLQVVSCDVKYQGSNDKGPYTIYEVAVLDADGIPVEQEFRSFDELPIDGEAHEFEVTPYHHPKYGTSYTLKLPGEGGGQKSPGARLGPKVDSLREEVGQLRELVAALERRVSTLEGKAPSGGLMSRTEPDEEEIPF
jgi:hypothetical protein